MAAEFAYPQASWVQESLTMQPLKEPRSTSLQQQHWKQSLILLWSNSRCFLPNSSAVEEHMGKQ